MPEEPKDRASLTEIMLGIAIAMIVAPGVIWWFDTIFAVLTGERAC